MAQCGADSLALDPLGGFNLTVDGVGRCVDLILASDVPTLFLGGGGYNQANAARYGVVDDVAIVETLLTFSDKPNLNLPNRSSCRPRPEKQVVSRISKIFSCFRPYSVVLFITSNITKSQHVHPLEWVSALRYHNRLLLVVIGSTID